MNSLTRHKSTAEYKLRRLSPDDPRTVEDFRREDGTIDIAAVVLLLGPASHEEQPPEVVIRAAEHLLAFVSEHYPRTTGNVTADLAVEKAIAVVSALWDLHTILSRTDAENGAAVGRQEILDLLRMLGSGGQAIA